MIGFLENIFPFENLCVRISSFTGVFDLIRFLKNIFHFQNWCMRNSNVFAHTISHSTNPLCSWFTKHSINVFLAQWYFPFAYYITNQSWQIMTIYYEGGRWAFRQLRKFLLGLANISENVIEVQFALKKIVNVVLSYFPFGQDSV